MLLAMSYHKANEEVKVSAGAFAAPGADEVVVFSNPLLASVGRLMSRLIPFLFVMGM